MKADVADMLIVGAGPAGAAAAQEAVSLGMRTQLLSDGPVGGLVNAARRLDNLPGRPHGIPAAAWVMECRARLDAHGIRPIFARVDRVAGSKTGFAVFSTRGIFVAGTVVLATGTRPLAIRPDLPHSPFLHREAATLPADLRGSSVAVIGSGEAAMDTALNMTDRGATVTLFARGGALRGNPALIAEFAASPVRLNVQAGAFSVLASGGPVHISFEHAADWQGNHAVFCIGRESRIDEIDTTDAAGSPGLFMAGDLIRENGRFIAPAAADGLGAARRAYTLIETRRNNRI